jgi:expansin (peptidoglycan-binding protein)
MKSGAALAIALPVLAGGCSLVDASGDGDGAEVCEAAEAETTTSATYDPTITEGGNCTYGPSADVMVVGVSELDYRGSVGCGGCLEVERAGRGSAVVRVVDSCLGCAGGEIVLSEDAFAMLEPNLDVGVIDVTWHWVECPTDDAIGIHFILDSNPLWLAVQVRNHRHRIDSLEARASGADSWLTLERADYNYFIAEEGLGEGPFDFRITDIYGHVMEESGMALGMDVVRSGTAQFPTCE